MILSGAMGKGKQVPRLGRNGSSKVSEMDFPWISAFSVICPTLWYQGVQLWLLFLMIILAVSLLSAQRLPQSQQDCFCVRKAETNFLALHLKRRDFLTKVECSIRRISGTLPSAMKSSEWFEFFQNYLQFSCQEAVPIIPIFLSILHFVGCFPQVFQCSSVISQSWKVYYLF